MNTNHDRQAIVITDRAGIEIASLLALRSALRLESLGMKRRGKSALAIARQRLNTKANRERCTQLLTEQIAILQNERMNKLAQQMTSPTAAAQADSLGGHTKPRDETK